MNSNWSTYKPPPPKEPSNFFANKANEGSDKPKTFSFGIKDAAQQKTSKTPHEEDAQPLQPDVETQEEKAPKKSFTFGGSSSGGFGAGKKGFGGSLKGFDNKAAHHAGPTGQDVATTINNTLGDDKDDGNNTTKEELLNSLGRLRFEARVGRRRDIDDEPSTQEDRDHRRMLKRLGKHASNKYYSTPHDEIVADILNKRTEEETIPSATTDDTYGTTTPPESATTASSEQAATTEKAPKVKKPFTLAKAKWAPPQVQKFFEHHCGGTESALLTGARYDRLDVVQYCQGDSKEYGRATNRCEENIFTASAAAFSYSRSLDGEVFTYLLNNITVPGSGCTWSHLTDSQEAQAFEFHTEEDCARAWTLYSNRVSAIHTILSQRQELAMAPLKKLLDRFGFTLLFLRKEQLDYLASTGWHPLLTNSWYNSTERTEILLEYAKKEEDALETLWKLQDLAGSNIFHLGVTFRSFYTPTMDDVPFQCLRRLMTAAQYDATKILAPDVHGATLLHAAAKNDRYDVVRFLLQVFPEAHEGWSWKSDAHKPSVARWRYCYEKQPPLMLWSPPEDPLKYSLQAENAILTLLTPHQQWMRNRPHYVPLLLSSGIHHKDQPVVGQQDARFPVRPSWGWDRGDNKNRADELVAVCETLLL